MKAFEVSVDSKVIVNGETIGDRIRKNIAGRVKSNNSRQGDEVIIIELDHDYSVRTVNVNDVRVVVEDDRVL